MRPFAGFLIVALTGLAGSAAAQDQAPDLSFLEYLGSWEEGDEEWLILAEIEADVDEPVGPDRPVEPDGQDEASTEDEENDDEQAEE